jgi:hypothetical protein
MWCWEKAPSVPRKKQPGRGGDGADKKREESPKVHHFAAKLVFFHSSLAMMYNWPVSRATLAMSLAG